MSIWINAGRNLRYREHESRRHGQRPDRFWSLHYTVNKRSHNEGVGWWSQGVTQVVCRELLAELQRNWRTGAGPQTLKELRAEGKAKAETREKAEADSRKPGLTLERFWKETVLPQIRLAYTKRTVLFSSYWLRNWLGPLLDWPLYSIKAPDLEMMVVKPMLEAGKRPATIEHVLWVFSMIWHKARRLELVTGDCPVMLVKRPRADNRRVRFLTPAEAARLLAALQERSQNAHDLALLSLFTGLRLGECAALTWADIDFENGLIFVKDTKNQVNRHAFMTAEVRAMLMRRRENKPQETELVFYGSRGGCCIHRLTLQPFRETVKALGFNEGVADPRQRLVFHSLRHSFASWLVMKGTPLYTVAKLLGHRNVKMTERYAHLAPEIQKEAAAKLECFLTEGGEEAMLTVNGRE